MDFELLPGSSTIPKMHCMDRHNAHIFIQRFTCPMSWRKQRRQRRSWNHDMNEPKERRGLECGYCENKQE